MVVIMVIIIIDQDQTQIIDQDQDQTQIIDQDQDQDQTQIIINKFIYIIII